MDSVLIALIRHDHINTSTNSGLQLNHFPFHINLCHYKFTKKEKAGRGIRGKRVLTKDLRKKAGQNLQKIFTKGKARYDLVSALLRQSTT